MWTGETTHIRFVWTRFSLKTEIWIHVDRTKDNSSLNRRPSINIYLPCMNDECLPRAIYIWLLVFAYFRFYYSTKRPSAIKFTAKMQVCE